MRVVADTNILVSAFLGARKPRAFLRACADERITLVVSEAILDELERVLQRPRFSASSEEVDRALAAVSTIAEIVTVVSEGRVVDDDPDDDVIVHTAVDGDAAYLVTGDKALLAVETFEGVEVLTVAAFLRDVLGS